MGFSEAVRSALIERYADFQGRAPRSEYWWFVVFNILMSIVIALVGAVTQTLGNVLDVIVTLALIVPNLAVSVRRLHDTDRSGWWFLLVLVPLLGTIVLIVWFVMRGTDGDNRFGPDPLGNVAERFA